MEHFFSPNSSGHVRSDAHQSQIIRGDADVDHTQTIGGDTVKLLGGHIPPGFGTPDTTCVSQKRVTSRRVAFLRHCTMAAQPFSEIYWSNEKLLTSVSAFTVAGIELENYGSKFERIIRSSRQFRKYLSSLISSEIRKNIRKDDSVIHFKPV